VAELEKCVWTEDDFEVMGWHDATVHAIALDWDRAEAANGGQGASLMLDIDYIVSWIHTDGPYRFEVAPATIVFEDVWYLTGDLDATAGGPLQLLDLHRDTSDDPAAWDFDGVGFALEFRARSFRQHFRSQPIANGERQTLSSARRGGPSFATPTAFAPSGA
jgi:hypothetical protein